MVHWFIGHLSLNKVVYKIYAFFITLLSSCDPKASAKASQQDVCLNLHLTLNLITVRLHEEIY